MFIDLNTFKQGGGISGLPLVVVDVLPTASADTMNKIYLVPSTTTKTRNVKDEYITIDNGVAAAERYTWEQIGSTAVDLTNYYNKTQTDNLLNAKENTISDLSDIRSGAALGATALQAVPDTYRKSADQDVIDAGKQATLVSGTNIKTINNNSILGSGNIEIQGGSGNEAVVTQAQYDAYENPDPNTTYIISDADYINMSDYTLNTSYNNLVAIVNTKADKQNISASTSGLKFPKWNADGLITGQDSQWYSAGNYINGNYRQILSTSSSQIANIYAPTSAGTQNQILVSNGSGAPVWTSSKIVFLTESQYEALATKDATTLYVITGE